MGSSIWLHPVLTSLLLFFSFSSSSSLQLCPHDQSSALLQLRGTFSINCSASSDSCSRYYAKTISWKKGTDCCLWDGVDCDAQSGNVIGLDLSCSCLHGTIHSNSSLFLLHHLCKLNLAYNNFSLSQISSEFGQFTSITDLNISDSGFSGLVSSVVPQLSRLVSLDLSYNYELRFDRNTFEKLLGNLISLRGLFLDKVNLSSIATSSFLNLSNSITSLSLEDSGLKGKFPDGVLHFPHLQKLSLSDNWNLIVNFPKTNWSSSLRSLELFFTNISGEIPDWIGNLRSLEVLNLSYCQLKGSIPTSLGNLEKLSTLDMSSNNLQGQIPDAFGNLTRLFYLDLASNYFSGQFPSFVFNLTQLEFLDISGNNLVGSLPYQATGLLLLQSLRLVENFITGRIPSWLFSLPSLVRLELTNNEFTGPIDQFEKPGPLVEVYLQNNKIHGSIPSSIFELMNLTVLDLSSNKLNDNVESAKLSKLGKLKSLDLSSNTLLSFSGFASANYNFSNLRSLDLSFCNINGFPDFIRNLDGLETLDLSYNQIPVINQGMLLRLKNLTSLDLSYNSQLSFSSFRGANGSLPNLRWLDLSSCNISGFPDFIRNLDGLEVLDLSHNQIPVIDQGMLLRLKNLTSLDLSYNSQLSFSSFSGANCSLPNLRSLGLSSCNISGFPDFIRNLDGLETLYLSHNQIPVIDQGMFLRLENLTSLDLSYNSQLSFSNFSGANCRLPNLRSLDLSSCNISGFPDFIRNLDGLETLDLSYNQIPVIDQGMVLRLKNLTSLDLSYNSQLSFSNFSGANCRLPNLRSLDLSSCNISGFPDFIRNLDGLETLDLSYNQIPVIDQSMVLRLKNLTSLDLSYNSQLSFSSFSGANCSLPNLRSLGLSSCNISGFPDFIRNLDGLETLDLSYNQIPIINQGMFLRLENLTYLDLSHNLLTNLDHHPWKNLQFLNLRSNLLQGPVLVPPPSIQYFLVSKNSLTGEIPSLICNLSSLEILDLSDNNLSGTIPTCPRFLSNLYVLNLQNNSFNGSIPDSFAKENKLVSLNLNDNDFDGPLPQSLVNCISLQVLNLGNNRLNGTLPDWLGTLLELQVLVLRSNNFHGPIGKAKIESPFPKLRILDLSHNEFSGVLPTTYFKSFKSMMNLDNVHVGYMGTNFFYYYHQDSVIVSMKGSEFKFERILTIFTAIDLSNNQFEGKIPERVGGLTSLIVLNFSHNSLSGSIPSSMGNLAAIESLDLSSNKLVGEIPKQLANLNFLEVLNLSQNQLFGPIPQGNQFDSFSNDSYSDNLGLCGVPLSKRCSENETPAFQEEDDHSASRSEWKGVMMGYGCGLVFGLSAGYIIFTIGKPGLLVRMVERAGNKFKKYLWSTK